VDGGGTLLLWWHCGGGRWLRSGGTEREGWRRSRIGDGAACVKVGGEMKA